MNDDILAEQSLSNSKDKINSLDIDPLNEQVDDLLVEILFKIPQESIKDIKLNLSIDLTIE